MCIEHELAARFGISRRRFFVTSAVCAAAAVCRHSPAQLRYGQVPGSVHGCTEVEPFPGTDAFKQSVQMATDEDLASAARNVAQMAAIAPELGVEPDTEPAAAAAMILGTGRRGSAPAGALAAPLGQSAPADLDALLPPRMALQRAKLWNRERGVTVSFASRPRDNACYEAIQSALDVWQSLLDMKLRRVDSSSADIRIGFGYPGFFSLVGTDSRNPALRRQFGGQSLNIQPGLTGQHYASVALHELGHALGAIHEHQSPQGDIPWNYTALYRYYGAPPNRWNKQQVDYQIVQKYSLQQVNASQFDPQSVMLYPVLEELLDQRDPDYRRYITGWNRSLSALDVSFMQEHYGRGSTSPPDTATEPSPAPEPDDQISRPADAKSLRLGDRVQSELTKYGKADWYRFEVTRTGRYVLETVDEDPATNMLLELYESGSLTRPKIAASYGGRRLLNARLSTELVPGTYYLRTSHRNRYGTGRYVLQFREE